jgi:hypothetical protein
MLVEWFRKRLPYKEYPGVSFLMRTNGPNPSIVPFMILLFVTRFIEPTASHVE